MKNYITKIFLGALFTILCTVQVNATNYTWVGGTSTAWGTAANWSPASVPSSASDNITIATGTYAPHLAANVTVNNFTITGNTLDCTGDTLIINGTGSFSGGTITNGLLQPRGGTILFSGTVIDIAVDAIVTTIKLNGSTFNKKCYFEATTNIPGTSDGGNTFNDTVTIKRAHTSSGIMYLANTNGNTFNKLLTLINVGTKEIDVAGHGTNTFNENIVVENSASGGIYFGGTAGGTSTLASGKTITIGSNGFTTGTLLLRDFTQSGSTAQSLTVTSSAIINIIGCTFGGNVMFTAPGVLCKANIFNGTFTTTVNGSSHVTWSGYNVFNSTASITNSSSSGDLRMDNDSANAFYGNLTLTSSAGKDIKMCFSGTTTSVYGNVTGNNAQVTFNSGTGTLAFRGGNAQTFYSPGAIVKDVLLKKSANSVMLDTTLTCTATWTFNKGNILTTSSHLLVFNAGSSVSGASDTSFVSGPVKKVGNTAFVFPTGKGNDYRAIEISAPSGSSDVFTGEYYNTGQTLANKIDSTIAFLNLCNYWNLSRNNGTSNVYVSLYWDNANCGIRDTNNFKIGVLKDTIWCGLERDSVVVNDRTGKLKSKYSITSYGYFTIANSNAGGYHNTIICNDRRVNVWGPYINAEHGDCFKATKNPTYPIINSTAVNPSIYCNLNSPQLSNVKSISSGYHHNLALLCDKTAVAWGVNVNHQLGNDATFNWPTPLSYTAIPVLVSIGGSQLTDIVAVAAGLYSSLALKKDGTVWQWGADNACLTNPGCTVTQLTGNSEPQQVLYSSGTPVTEVISIAAGGWHFMMLLKDGSVFTWGRNNNGQLGLGNAAYSSLNKNPQKVVKAPGGGYLTEIKAIAAGGNHCLALDINNRVWAWGSNSYGQCGNNSGTNCLSATAVWSGIGNSVQLTDVSSIGAGSFHSLAIKSGDVYSWGDNQVRQLGQTLSSLVPSKITFPIAYPMVYAASGGDLHSVALSTDNRIYGWGDGSEYQMAQPATNLNCTILSGFCIAPTPIEIGNYTPQPICTPLVPCDRNVTYCIFDYEITNNNSPTWTTTTGTPNCFKASNTSELYIENELLIRKGSSLTINTGITLYFGPNGRIVLEEGNGTLIGGQLILNNGSKLTAAGDCMWKGVEVRGVSTFPGTSARQAKLTVNAGAIIEHAHNGVLLGRWDEGYYAPCVTESKPVDDGLLPYVLANSGGIINCSGGIFQNNAIDIRFAPYSNLNASTINASTDFNGGTLRDSRYQAGIGALNVFYAVPNAYKRTSIGIRLDSYGNTAPPSFNLTITGNTFQDMEKGIAASASRFTVSQNNFLSPGAGMHKITYGIYSYTYTGSPFFGKTITTNTFKDVVIPVSINAGQYDNISGINQFNSINPFGTQADNTTAIQMQQSSGFSIVDNNIRQYNFGMIINGSGKGGGLIGYGSATTSTGNIFTDCKTSIKAQGGNPKLQISCNFFDNATGNNLYSRNWDVPLYNIGGIKALGNQGKYSASSTTPGKDPAGNFWQVPIVRKEITSALGNQQFTYFHHPSPANVIPIPTAGSPIVLSSNANAGTFSAANSCPANPFVAPANQQYRIWQQDSVITELVELNSNITSHISNEETQLLIDTIQTTGDSEDLTRILAEASPLSDTVLANALLNIDIFDSGHLLHVLLNNSALSDALLAYAKIKLETTDYDSLLSVQGSTAHSITGIGNRMENEQITRQLLKNDLLRYYADNDSLGALLGILNAETSAVDKMMLCDTYLQLDSVSRAQQELDNASNMDDAAPDDWLTLHQIAIDLTGDGKTWFEMDSTQEAIVRSIANQSPASLAAVQAQGVLYMVFGEEYAMQIEGEGERYADFTQNTKAKTEPQKVKEYLYGLKPNPAKNSFTFNYFVPVGVNYATIEVTDATGKIVLNKKLNNSYRQDTVIIENLSIGVYFVKLLHDKNLVAVVKLVKL